MESLRQQTRGRQPALVVLDVGLAAYLAVFVLLSVDVLVRILVVRAQFDSTTDAAVLLLLEGARALTLALTLALAVVIRLGRERRSGSRTFALLLVFLGIAYAKAMAFAGFPGFAQERLALRLSSMGVHGTLTNFVFGSPPWAVWLALGAFLRLVATYPVPADAGIVERSGVHDRRGMMRSVALAGADVGAAFRAAAAATLRAGWLRAAIVWPAVAAAGILHSLVAVPAVRLILSGALAAGAALAITIGRAGYGTAGEDARRRVLWIVQAAALAGSAFLVSAVLSFGTSAVSALVSLTVATAAPFAVLAALRNGVAAGANDARRAVRRTLVIGAGAVIGAAGYKLLLAALTVLAVPSAPPTELFIVLMTAFVAMLFGPRLREVADRTVPDPPET